MNAWSGKAMLTYKLRPRQYGRHFADDICKCIFLNQIVWTVIAISLQCVHECQINNIPALIEIMAWCRPGDKHYLNQWYLAYSHKYASLDRELRKVAYWGRNVDERSFTVTSNMHFKHNSVDHDYYKSWIISLTLERWWCNFKYAHLKLIRMIAITYFW